MPSPSLFSTKLARFHLLAVFTRGASRYLLKNSRKIIAVPEPYVIGNVRDCLITSLQELAGFLYSDTDHVVDGRRLNEIIECAQELVRAHARLFRQLIQRDGMHILHFNVPQNRS